MNRRDREKIAGELIKIAKDLVSEREAKIANSRKGPVWVAVYDGSDELKDMNYLLDKAVENYSWGAKQMTYAGNSKGAKDAKAMESKIAKIKKEGENLYKSLWDLAKDESAFESKYGRIDVQVKGEGMGDWNDPSSRWHY
jgi:hypothetical protein